MRLFDRLQRLHRKNSSKLAHKAVLLPLHDAAFDRNEIVVAFEVKQAVNEVTHEFGLPCGSEAARLTDGVIDADENVAKEWSGAFRGRVGEGDHIGGTFVAEVLPIDPGHLGRADDEDSQLIRAFAQPFCEDVLRDSPKKPEVEPETSLTIAKIKGPFKNNFGFWRERGLARCEARGGRIPFMGL